MSQLDGFDGYVHSPNAVTATIFKPGGVMVQVLYPSSATFDLKYYLGTHIPMVKQAWSTKGLSSCNVTELDKSSGFQVQCMMIWTSQEELTNAMQGSEEAKTIMADVDNFSNEKPTRWVSKIVG